MSAIFARSSHLALRRSVLSQPLGVGLLRLMSGMKERARIAVKPRALLTINNEPYRVTKIQQGKRGKGGGFVKGTLKNMMTGTTTEKTYTSDEMVELAHLEKSTVTFSWMDDSTKELVLMDTTTFEEVRVLQSAVDCAKYLSEGQEVLMLSFQGQPFDLEIPKVCEFTIDSIDASKSTGNTGTCIYMCVCLLLILILSLALTLANPLQPICTHHIT